MTQPASEEECRFRCEGDEWRISYAGSTCRMRETKGLRYLAALLARPGKSIPAGDLAAAARSAAGTSASLSPEVPGRAPRAERDPSHEAITRMRERERLAVSRRIRAAIARITAAHPALGRHLEVTIRCGYDCRYCPDPRLEIRWET